MLLVLMRSLNEWGAVKRVKCRMALSTWSHPHPGYPGAFWELKVTLIVAHNHLDLQFFAFFFFWCPD